MKFKNLIKLEKDNTTKKYKFFIDKAKSLKNVNIKEEINKRNYIKDENASLNIEGQLKVYQIQSFFLVGVVILQIVLNILSYILDEIYYINVVPYSFATVLGVLFMLIAFIGNIYSIKTNCQDKKAESIQALSAGLILGTVIIQGLLLFYHESERMVIMGGNVILIGFTILTIITHIIKLKKIKEPQ